MQGECFDHSCFWSRLDAAAHILRSTLRKEFFRVMLKYDLDFYEVVHKARQLTGFGTHCCRLCQMNQSCILP